MHHLLAKILVAHPFRQVILHGDFVSIALDDKHSFDTVSIKNYNFDSNCKHDHNNAWGENKKMTEIGYTEEEKYNHVG